MTFGNAAKRHRLSLIIFLKWIDYRSFGRDLCISIIIGWLTVNHFFYCKEYRSHIGWWLSYIEKYVALMVYWMMMMWHTVRIHQMGYVFIREKVVLLNTLLPDFFFRSFSGQSLRWALVVYRLIVTTLLGNFLMIPS